MPGLRRVVAHGRRSAWLLLPVSIVLLGAAPLATAAAPAVQIFGALDIPVPIQFLALVDDGDAGPTAAATGLVAPHCDASTYGSDPEGHSFSFREDDRGDGCLSVLYNLTLPAGTQQFDLSFDANRSVRQGMVSTGAAPDMVQTVRLLVDGQGANQEPFTVFRADEGTRTRQAFRHSFLVPEGASRLQLEWQFADAGRLAGSAAPGGLGPGAWQAFSASVWDPVVHFGSIPLPAPALEGQGALDANQAYVTHYAFAASVPDAFQAAREAGEFSLRIQLDAALRSVRVDGPDGTPLAAAAYSTQQEGGTRIVLPAETLRALGPGPYTVHADADEALQRHATYAALSYVALAAPLAAIAAAWFGLRRLETGPDGEAEP